LFQVKELTVQFGGLTAVDRVSFEVERNQILSIIGPNGAGKTTIFSAITGFCHGCEGSIRFKKEELNGLKPHEIAKRGITRTFQKTNVFRDMTVLENVVTASNRLFRSGYWGILFNSPLVRKEERKRTERAIEILRMCGIEHRCNDLAQNLSYGEGRLLEIGIALAVEPELLLFDEPAAGLNPVETQNLVVFIRKLKDLGHTILLVEHDMSVVMTISDHILVVNFGKKIAEGLPQEISENQEVIQAYLGTKSFQNRRARRFPSVKGEA